MCVLLIRSVTHEKRGGSMEKCHIRFLINKSAQLISLYKSSTMENVLFLPKLKKKTPTKQISKTISSFCY